MSSYKLYYFNITGLGEPIRYMLHYNGVKFEDKRLSFDEWPKYKPKMPLGQMPVLEIDGKQYHQSKSIMRFLGKKFGMYGSDDFEALEIDAAADGIDDARQGVSGFYWEEDPVQKEKLKTKALTKLNFLLDKFDAQVKANGGYFVGGKVSWADLLFAGFNDYMSHALGYPLTKDHAELKKLVDKVRSNAHIKNYLDNGPKGQF